MLTFKHTLLAITLCGTAMLTGCHAGDKGHTISADSVKTFGPYSKDSTTGLSDQASPAALSDTTATKNADKTAAATDTLKKPDSTAKQ